MVNYMTVAISDATFRAVRSFVVRSMIGLFSDRYAYGLKSSVFCEDIWTKNDVSLF